MLLSIIIPQYKEENKTVRRLLSSIDYQLNVNWSDVEVIIVNDHSDVLLSDEMLDSFENIRPIYVKLEKNVGPGLARQAGLDIAKGDYVTFCDADDMYQNFGTLSLYFSLIKKDNPPDIIATQWLEELKMGDGLAYLTHDNECTWMHGKCFKRSFLISHNLRFSDTLFYHEDSYFLSNAFALTQNVVRVPAVSYVWTYDATSITRRDEAAYSYNSMPEFIRSITSSITWLKDRVDNGAKLIPYKVFQLCMYIYYCIQVNPNWPKEWITLTEKELANTYKLYQEEFNSVDGATVAQIDFQEREKVKDRAFIMSETFSQFMNRIINTKYED